MPQISVVGSGGDYSTIAEWEAAESGSDYGVGNPAIAEITGTLNESTAISGAFVRGFIVRAKAGEEYDPVTNTGAGNSDQFRPSITTSGVTARFENIFVGNGVLCYGSATVELDGCTIERPSGGNAFQDNGAPAMWAYNTLFRNCARAFDGPSGDTNYGCTNCTSVNVTGSFSFVRGVFINCLTLDKGFAATTTGSDYNASTNTTAPGANSLINRTTADVVDYAGGDYRTASGSALATAGNGTDAAYIGYALEAGGGPTYSLTLDAGSYVYTGSAVDLIVGRKIGITAGSYTYTGSPVDLIAGRKLSITPGAYTYTGSAADLIAGRKLTIDPSSYNYTGNDVTLTYTSAGGATYSLTLDAGSYALTGSSVDLLVNRKLSLDAGSFSYTGSAVNLIVGRKLTITAGSYAVNGQAVDLKAGRKLSIDAGAYNYSGLPVTLSYSGVVISLISGYSVQYRQDDISINFNSDNIQAEFT